MIILRRQPCYISPRRTKLDYDHRPNKHSRSYATKAFGPRHGISNVLHENVCVGVVLEQKKKQFQPDIFIHWLEFTVYCCVLVLI